MGEDHGATALGLQAGDYLRFLDGWMMGLPAISCDPAATALLLIDVIAGFCEHGNLASELVATMVPPLVHLVDTYQQAGGTAVLLAEDAHRPDAREFASFPPHCLAGTAEARTVQALAALETPAWRRFPKQTINALAEPALRDTVEALLRAGVRTFVIGGDCTDLCIYQVAMALQLLLNRDDHAQYSLARVVVPASVVRTYDLSVEAAQSVGAHPHPGPLLHALFLQHMALNGLLVVDEVTWMRR